MQDLLTKSCSLLIERFAISVAAVNLTANLQIAVLDSALQLALTAADLLDLHKLIGFLSYRSHRLTESFTEIFQKIIGHIHFLFSSCLQFFPFSDPISGIS